MTIQEQSPPISTIPYRPLELSKSEQDRQLVLLHLQGDPDAFSIIAENHYRALTARARSLLGPHGEIEDAVQETFLRALRALPRFGITGEYKVGAWLTTILSNVCSDQRSRASKDRLLAESAGRDLPHHADVAEQVGDPQTVETMKAAIADLSPALRRAFIRHELDHVPYAVMAEAENSSVELARQQVHRAKSTLRRNLAGIESAAGGALALPVLRSLRARLAAHLGRRQRSVARVLGAGHRLNPTTASGGSFGRATPSLFDRMASTVTSSPLGQSALALWTGTPRGTTIVFGMAAAVATLSAGAVIVSAVTPPASPSAPASHTAPAPALLSAGSTSTTTGAEQSQALAFTAPASTSSSGSGLTSSSSSTYPWVNAGVGGPAATGVPVGLPVGGCSIPATVAQSAGSAGLGLADALSVASAPAVALPTVGPTVQFSTGASLSSFSSAAPGAISVALTTNACASTQSAWFSAQVSGIGTATPLQLNGTLVEVIGTAGDVSYIFRGQVAPDASMSPAAAPLLAGATEFVAQLEVTEPANMAQLTVVFLDPTLGTTADDSATPGATTPAAGTTSDGTAAAAGTTSDGTAAATGTTSDGTAAATGTSAQAPQIGSGLAGGAPMPTLPPMPTGTMGGAPSMFFSSAGLG